MASVGLITYSPVTSWGCLSGSVPSHSFTTATSPQPFRGFPPPDQGQLRSSVLLFEAENGCRTVSLCVSSLQQGPCQPVVHATCWGHLHSPWMVTVRSPSTTENCIGSPLLVAEHPYKIPASSSRCGIFMIPPHPNSSYIFGTFWQRGYIPHGHEQWFQALCKTLVLSTPLRPVHMQRTTGMA